MDRQYIGARYVPKFFENPNGGNEWIKNTTYEPLTIVSYLGASYTSKKPVPYGVEITNTEYWVLTGNYNAQVAEYLKEVQSYNGRIEDLEKANVFLIDNVDIKQNGIVWIGDSYVEAVSLGDNQNKRFSTLVSNKLGLTEYNYAKGGTGLFYDASAETTFYQQAVNAYTDLTSKNIDLNTIKYVVVAGGRNDPYHQPNANLSTYNTAIIQLISYITTHFPKSKIVVIPFLYDASEMTTTTFQAYLFASNCYALQPVMLMPYAYTILTGSFNQILTDGVHPNVGGHDLIAACVYEFIVGGFYRQQITTLNEKSANLDTEKERYCYAETMNGSTGLIYAGFTIKTDVTATTVLFESNNLPYQRYVPYFGAKNITLLAENVTTKTLHKLIFQYVDTSTSYTKLQLAFGYDGSNALTAGEYRISMSRAIGHH